MGWEHGALVASGQEREEQGRGGCFCAVRGRCGQRRDARLQPSSHRVISISIIISISIPPCRGAALALVVPRSPPRERSCPSSCRRHPCGAPTDTRPLSCNAACNAAAHRLRRLPTLKPPLAAEIKGPTPLPSSSVRSCVYEVAAAAASAAPSHTPAAAVSSAAGAALSGCCLLSDPLLGGGLLLLSARGAAGSLAACLLPLHTTPVHQARVCCRRELSCAASHRSPPRPAFLPAGRTLLRWSLTTAVGPHPLVAPQAG
jgi:hypothetical protein